MKIRNLVLALGVVCAFTAQAQQFIVKIENIGPQPLSPFFLSSSNASFDTFQVGGSASLGIKNIAETGSTAAMVGIATAAGSAINEFKVVPGGPVMPGTSRTVTLNADPSRGYFSFASMLGMTNDGWIGESVSSRGLMLFNGNTPIGFTEVVTGQRAWDAGTEMNTQNAADLAPLGGAGNPAEDPGMNLIRVHESIILNRGDSWQQLPDWNNDTQLARITVTPVPEPGTMLAILAGVGGYLRTRRKK